MNNHDNDLEERIRREIEIENLPSVRRFFRGFGACQAAGFGYMTYLAGIDMSSIVEDVQRGTVGDYVVSGAKLLWGAITTLVTVDGLYDSYRGTHHGFVREVIYRQKIIK